MAEPMPRFQNLRKMARSIVALWRSFKLVLKVSCQLPATSLPTKHVNMIMLSEQFIPRINALSLSAV